MLEQYGFLKTMFDFSSDKAKEVAFWSFTINAITVLMGWYNYLANDVLGITPFVVIMLFVIMVADLCTGVFASVSAREKCDSDKFRSKKFLRWIFKFGSYIVFIYMINGLTKESSKYGFDWLVYFMNAIKMFVLFFISFGELMSVGENLEKAGYKIAVFKLVHKIYMSFVNIFKKNTDIDLNDGEE